MQRIILTLAVLVLFVCLTPTVASTAETKAPVSDTLPPIDTMPVLTHFVKAAYPDSLVKQGIEGIVGLDIVVSDSGKVDSVAVVRGLYPVLDSAAKAACKAFVFKPAISAGKPVPVLMEYDYRFSINEILARIDTFVNVTGHIYEQGTRTPLVNATVVVTCSDTAADTSLHVPFFTYLFNVT